MHAWSEDELLRQVENTVWAKDLEGKTIACLCLRTLSTAGSGRRSCQCMQYGPGLLQVRGVKALGEPDIERRQELARFSALALALSQPAEAQGGTEFPRLGLVAARDIEGLVPTRLDLRRSGRGAGLHEQRLALEYIELGSEDGFFRNLDGPQGLGDGGQPVVHLADTLVRFRQQSQQIGPHQAYAHGREALQATVDG
jgi:hypothetical protein